MAGDAKRLHITPIAVIPLLLGLALVLGHRGAMSALRTEIGGIASDRGLVMLRESPSEPNPYLDQALRNYHAAIAWDSTNAHAWRRLGEVYLTLGQNDAARDALTRAVELRPHSYLYQLLLGDAYDGLGASREALDAWTAGRGGTLRRDGILVNGTKIASAHVQAGDPLSAVPILRDTVLRVDPDNLFALAVVVTAYDSAVEGDHPLADPYREGTRYPSRRALAQGSDARLAEYQAQGAILLHRFGYWDEQVTAGTARYWAMLGNPASVHLARALHESEPAREEWVLLLAEALVRCGRPSEAVDLLADPRLAGSPSVLRWRATAQLQRARTGMNEEQWAAAREAIGAYAAVAADDLWPLAVETEVEFALGQTEAAEASASALVRRTEGVDVASAAQMLNLRVDEVVLGDNLVVNGDFSTWDAGAPSGWIWSDMATGDPWNLGLYVGGADDVRALGDQSVWVQGVWQQSDPEKHASRAGYWLFDASEGDRRQLPVEVGATYIVSLDYLVEDGGQPLPTIWLSDEESPCWKNDKRLDWTAGEWRHAAWVCGPASSDDDPLRPLVRLFGTGLAMFDNLQVREVRLVENQGKE